MQETDGKPDGKTDGKPDGKTEERTGPQRAPGSRADIEHRAFVEAVERLALEGDRAEAVRSALADFAADLEAWRETAKARQEQMLRLRRNAPTDRPPSEEFRRVAVSIEESRPKLADLEQRVYGMLDENEGARLKDLSDAVRKEIRAAMAREAQAKRAAAKEDMDRRRRAREAGEGKPADGSGKKPSDGPGASPG